jgi:hypothetical protein
MVYSTTKESKLTNESSHSNTSVLDLSMAKESNGSLVGLSPDGGGSKLEGIVVLENRVGLLSNSYKVILSSLGSYRGRLASLGSKGSSGGEKGCEDGELHIGN